MQPYQKWIFSGLLTASSLFAAEPTSQNMNDSKPPPLGQITPPAGPRTDTGARFLVTADFIYWQLEQDNLVGLPSEYNSFSGNTQTTTKKDAYLDFKYAPGFKVGAGAVFDYDNWDLFANYTWLKQNHAHGSSLKNSVADLREGKTAYKFSEIRSIRRHWTCHFNDIDLELGRQFFISKGIVLRPHFGIKGGWINQKFNLLANYTFNPGSVSNILSTTHQDFWGIGLRCGLNTAWHFTRNWSVYGDIAASELACRFKIREKTVTTESSPSLGTNTDIDLRTGSFYTIKPVLELALGVRYEMLFSQDRYQFFAQAGWEQQIWWDQNQLSGRTDFGNLTLQGLDVKLGFAF